MLTSPAVLSGVGQTMEKKPGENNMEEEQ